MISVAMSSSLRELNPGPDLEILPPVSQLSREHGGVGQQRQGEDLHVDQHVSGVLQDHLLLLRRHTRHLQSPINEARPARGGGGVLLTEEPLVLVRGNRILWEELTSEGQLRWAVILA